MYNDDDVNVRYWQATIFSTGMRYLRRFHWCREKLNYLIGVFTNYTTIFFLLFTASISFFIFLHGHIDHH